MINWIAEATKRLLLPELQKMSAQLGELNAHVVRLEQRLDQTNARLDKIHADLIARDDKVYAELIARNDQTNARLDIIHQDLIRRIDETRGELRSEIAQNTDRIDRMNARIDEVVLDLNKIHDALVRREDYERLREQVHELEKKVALLTR
jgi:polyhydroxyalkanoate synthesis regulator phasin